MHTYQSPLVSKEVLAGNELPDATTLINITTWSYATLLLWCDGVYGMQHLHIALMYHILVLILELDDMDVFYELLREVGLLISLDLIVVYSI